LPPESGAGDVTASDAPDTTPDEVPPSAGDTVDRNDDPDGAMTVPGLAAEGDCDPEGSPGRRPDVDPMAVLDDLDRAVWIYDPERHCLVWGNRGALALWDAEDASALAGRRLEPLTEAARRRLGTTMLRLEAGETVSEQWTFYPRGRARTVRCTMRRHRLPDGRRGLLVDADPDDRSEIDFQALRGLEAFRHVPVMIGLFTLEGALLQCNPAAAERLDCRADKPMTEPFLDPHDLVGLMDQVRSGLVWRGEIRMRTTVGIRWHATEAHPVRDPVTGTAAVLITQVDVTDRRNTEVALRDSRDRLEEAERLTRVGSWELILADQTVHWSDQLYRNFGLENGDGPMTLEVFRSLLHPDDVPIVEAMVERALAEGGSYDLVHRVIRPSGEIGWISGRARVECDMFGCPVRLFGTAQDVTAQKQAEEALRLSEERFRQVVEAAGEYIWEIDTDARFIFVTDRAEAVLGPPVADIIGRRLYDFMPPEDSERMERFFAEEVMAVCRTFTGVETRLQRPDGSVGWQRLSGVPVLAADGSLRGYRGAGLDVTEEHRLAERLREMQRAELARVMAAVDGASDGIAILGDGGHIEYANRSLTALFGRSPKDLDRRGGIATLVGAPAEAREWGGEATIERPDGASVDITVRLSPILDAWGQQLGRMAMLTDVTDIKRAERERRLLEQQFFQSQKLEAVGRLAGGIAHDFNNILAAIIGYDTFLVDDLPEGTEQRRYAEQIGQAAERAKALVRRLLAFSRRGEEETEPVDLARLVQETAQMLRATLPSSIDLDVAVAARPVTIKGNATQLSQVLMNLGVNARDAIGDRHGTIRLALEAVPPGDGPHPAAVVDRVRLGIEPDTPAVARLTVGDTGLGMPSEVMAHIFEPFFTTKDKAVGTGLGLAAVHGIVEAHHGSVTVESTPGAGTVFEIRLPIAAADAAPAPLRGTVPSCSNSATILVVDDEEMVATMTARTLERSGYEVVATTDPSEALEALLGDPEVFDCVITDQTMPGMTGLELIEAVAREGLGVPILLLSGNVSGLEDRALAAGAKAVLRKPVEREELVDAIEAALAERRLTAAAPVPGTQSQVRAPPRGG